MSINELLLVKSSLFCFKGLGLSWSFFNFIKSKFVSTFLQSLFKTNVTLTKALTANHVFHVFSFIRRAKHSPSRPGEEVWLVSLIRVYEYTVCLFDIYFDWYFNPFLYDSKIILSNILNFYLNNHCGFLANFFYY